MSDAPRKPRRRRKNARPSEIVEAGLQEFSRHGFAATRLDDVAARAGVVKGTIYRYFESKEALFEAAVRSRVLPTLTEANELVDRYPGSSEELLRLVLQTIYSKLLASDLPVLIRILISEGHRFPELTAYYHGEAISRGQALLKKIVERGIARGEFRKGPIADLPIVLVAPAIMAAIWKMTFDRHQPIALESFLEAHLDLIFDGLKRHEM